jgi:hypothetical protein
MKRTGSEKVLLAVGLIALIIASTFANLYFGLKIYAITMIGANGAPPLTMSQLYAVSIFLTAMTAHAVNNENSSVKKVTEKAIGTAIGMAAVWGYAALIHAIGLI